MTWCSGTVFMYEKRSPAQNKQQGMTWLLMEVEIGAKGSSRG